MRSNEISIYNNLFELKSLVIKSWVLVSNNIFFSLLVSFYSLCNEKGKENIIEIGFWSPETHFKRSIS